MKPEEGPGPSGPCLLEQNAALWHIKMGTITWAFEPHLEQGGRKVRSPCGHRDYSPEPPSPAP